MNFQERSIHTINSRYHHFDNTKGIHVLWKNLFVAIFNEQVFNIFQ